MPLMKLVSAEPTRAVALPPDVYKPEVPLDTLCCKPMHKCKAERSAYQLCHVRKQRWAHQKSNSS